MFRKKKETDWDYPPDGLVEMVNALAKQQAETVLREAFYLGAPTITVSGSDGTTPADYGLDAMKHYVDRGRWYARVNGKPILGDVDRAREKEMIFLRDSVYYKGFATPDAAEKAAKAWYDSLPTPKAKS